MSQIEVPIRIATWSGPRNISTAMMRAWDNRRDTFVIDEPFYAYYLKATRKQHPGADEVIATGETDWRKVVAQLTGPIPNGKRIFFQKQMTHHLLPDIDRQWLGSVTNCFLIRDPREVIVSYRKKREDPALEDLGYVQQMEIFDFVRARTNAIPPILDAKDVLENPKRMLRLLCKAVGVDYKNGSFTTFPGASPGACTLSLHHGSFVLGGITGSFTGWVSGTVTAATYNPHGCDVPATCTTRTTMIQALFPGGSYDITSFNFEYQSSDGSLYYRHWQDKSAKDGGEKFEGDIANS